jgi:hypothetical protein
MTETQDLPTRALRRLHLFAVLTRVLAVLLVPVALLRNPAHPLRVAANWALAMRFPAESLTGLTHQMRQALQEARSAALWRDGVLIGVTSGYRDPTYQWQLFSREVGRTGSSWAARSRVLPPDESAHVQGIAVDVRPRAGARWLDQHGAGYRLYRIYDNEWWHFEFHTAAPARLPSPRFARTERALSDTGGHRRA